MKRVLAFLSDFGSSNPYPAAMRAVAAGITPARIIDITHDIGPRDVLEGAFVLWSVAPYFPASTVFCAVVDPGVGTARRGLIFTSGQGIFVGPDNGLLIPAVKAIKTTMHAYEIVNPRFFRHPVSSTFQGRDIFASVAAHLCNGVPAAKIGQPISQWVEPDLDFQGGRFLEEQGAFYGQVVYVDRFGNAITNIPTKLIRERVVFDDELLLKTERHESRVRFRKSYGFADPGELCLVPGSHDLLEIALREGSAHKTLQLQVRAEITLYLR